MEERPYPHEYLEAARRALVVLHKISSWSKADKVLRMDTGHALGYGSSGGDHGSTGAGMF